MSHPVRGAWIEISTYDSYQMYLLSHPVRGAWIEIRRISKHSVSYRSHPVRGAWIEILVGAKGDKGDKGRTPSGVRGLKSRYIGSNVSDVDVAPRQGCVD